MGAAPSAGTVGRQQVEEGRQDHGLHRAADPDDPAGPPDDAHDKVFSTGFKRGEVEGAQPALRGAGHVADVLGLVPQQGRTEGVERHDVRAGGHDAAHLDVFGIAPLGSVVGQDAHRVQDRQPRLHEAGDVGQAGLHVLVPGAAVAGKCAFGTYRFALSSLVPSQTELLYDLGLGDRVVGITKFCIHPEAWFRTKHGSVARRRSTWRRSAH